MLGMRIWPGEEAEVAAEISPYLAIISWTLLSIHSSIHPSIHPQQGVWHMMIIQEGSQAGQQQAVYSKACVAGL